MSFENQESKKEKEESPDLSSHRLLSDIGLPTLSGKSTTESGNSKLPIFTESHLLSMDSARANTDSAPKTKLPIEVPSTETAVATMFLVAAIATIGRRPGNTSAFVSREVPLLGKAASETGRLEMLAVASGENTLARLPLSSRLALDTGTDIGSHTPLALTINRPLPKFSTFDSVAAGEIAPMSAQALKMSQEYVETGLLSGRIIDGVRLPTVVDSAGFSKMGGAINRAEQFIVVDRQNDPILRAAIEDARQRYAGIPVSPQMAMDLRNHVSQLMNRYNLPGEELAAVYEQTLRRGCKEIPVGLFLSKGSGVCLPRSAVFKTIADDLGLPVRMREGMLGIKRPQPHVWNEAHFNTKWQVYDASHAPNPLFNYTSLKH